MLRTAVDMCKTGIQAGGQAVLVKQQVSVTFGDGMAFKKGVFAAKKKVRAMMIVI